MELQFKMFAEKLGWRLWCILLFTVSTIEKWSSCAHRTSGSLLGGEELDWDKGLPPDVLALVARAGGIKAMQQMRGVSSQWKEGFELGVKGIRVSQLGPLLPLAGETARRFPMVESLMLGNSLVEESWLEGLGAFVKLTNLVLGELEKHYIRFKWDGVFDILRVRLTDAGLLYLQGLPLTGLNLRSCSAFTDQGLGYLQGMPLRQLDLSECQGLLTRAGFEQLRGLPLTCLNLEDTNGVSEDLSEGLGALQGMPLTHLNIGQCAWLTNAGLQHLRGLPLTSLDVGQNDSRHVYGGNPWKDLSEGFSVLRDLPLVYLRIRGCHWLQSLDMLRGLKLTSLDIFECIEVTDENLSSLRGMPLAILELGDVFKVADLRHLSGMPITTLGLYERYALSSDGIEVLKGLPLTDLELVRCYR